MDTLLWVHQVIDGEPRFLRVKERSLRFHLAAGWAPVDEAEVPEEVRSPPKPKPARRPAPAPARRVVAAPPRRRRSPISAPAEEN